MSRFHSSHGRAPGDFRLEEAIAKADTLVEALSWIRQLRGKVTVIKLGGSVMRDEIALQHTLLDVVFMETVGMRPVLVHGGGPAINAAMDAAGIQPRFIQGRRYTDAQTLAIVEKSLAGETNRRLAELIEELGGRAMPLNFESTNVLFGERISLEGEDGEKIDLGHVGQITRIDQLAIENLCYAGQVPVIPSMCLDAHGNKLNVNADTAAKAVAELLCADKLVFLSDIPGVLGNPDDPTSLIHTLDAANARELMDSGVIAGGMLPKIEACLETLQRGVNKVHIIDGRVRHSLLLEIYTSSGVGTQIISQRGAKVGSS